MLIALYSTRNYRRTQEETILHGEIDRSNHVVLNEKAGTRVTDSFKSSPDINHASSSIAMNIDWRMEYALSSDHIRIVIFISPVNSSHTMHIEELSSTSAKLTAHILKMTLN